MSSDEPAKPYVYQPFGSVTSDKARVEAGRLWGVGFPYSTHRGLAKVEGLTKAEAERVCAALGNCSPQAEADTVPGDKQP